MYICITKANNMNTIIRKTANVTVTDITIEAKQILSNAMNAFCKPQDAKEKQKQMFICERHNYWLGMGFNNEVATQKANEDYEWAF